MAELRDIEAELRRGCMRDMFKLFMFILTVITIYLLCRCTKINEPTLEGQLQDIDGNLYHTQVYGTQTWMLEDLLTTRYNDGVAIWTKDLSTCYLGQYTFYMVEYGKLCPINWHVPASWEFEVLNNYFNSNDVQVQIGNMGYWWSSSNIVEGYESPQARAWYQNVLGTAPQEFITLKGQYLGIRCVKDY